MNKITIERAVLEQALEALEKPSNLVIRSLSVNEAIRSLRNAQAQPQSVQEPLGFMNAGHVHEMQQGRLPYGYVYPKDGAGASVAVYTSPQAQPLSDDLINDLARTMVKEKKSVNWLAYAIEAAITKGTT